MGNDTAKYMEIFPDNPKVWIKFVLKKIINPIAKQYRGDKSNFFLFVERFIKKKLIIDILII